MKLDDSFSRFVYLSIYLFIYLYTKLNAWNWLFHYWHPIHATSIILNLQFFKDTWALIHYTFILILIIYALLSNYSRLLLQGVLLLCFYVQYCRRATRGEEGGGLPCPFLKIEKKCPAFGKKGPNCVHPWVESSIQNVVLRVSRGKSAKTFPCGAFFLVFLTKSLSKCLNSAKPPLP